MFSFITLLTTFAKTTAPSCSRTFFGLKPWYAYLKLGSYPDCGIQGFTVNGSGSSFLLIGLAVLDDLIRVASLVAVGYVVYGGIQYVTSQGAPEATSKARQTIINALIGLGIAIVAASIVAFIGNKLGNLS